MGEFRIFLNFERSEPVSMLILSSRRNHTLYYLRRRISSSDLTQVVIFTFSLHSFSILDLDFYSLRQVFMPQPNHLKRKLSNSALSRTSTVILSCSFSISTFTLFDNSLYCNPRHRCIEFFRRISECYRRRTLHFAAAVLINAYF